jgi:deoxyribodipyrimidine photo-lyase
VYIIVNIIMKQFQNGLFIFRRDLRLEDNTGLIEAIKSCKNLFTCFIFTPEQVGSNNPYKSFSSIQFMIESLKELSENLEKKGGKLAFFYGKNNKVIQDIIKKEEIQCIFFNRDYTPYAIQRDQELDNLCNKNKIVCKMCEDYYLYTPGIVLNGSGNAYQKFTPFYEKVLHMDVKAPQKISSIHFLKLPHTLSSILLEDAQNKFQENIKNHEHGVNINKNLLVQGGRTHGIKQLNSTKNTQQHYEITRNQLHKETSLLSAYLKFGCVSVREVYVYFVKHFGKRSEILRQLIWRDFYAHLLYAYPNSINHRKNNPQGIRWGKNQGYFEKWCRGETGFPVVDACMRQLNTTGWMHNRGRLIVSCFLIKTLLVDWRWGEMYFAKKLVDYDVASNNGNWQWIAGTGVDSMPYFRIFNPWTQSKMHDPECIFIRKWIPELNTVKYADIHEWYISYKIYPDISYPKPIVDFGKQHERSLEMYKNAMK